MEQLLNAITISVKNIPILKKFYYDVFGWSIVSENESVVMFKLNQAILTLCSENIFDEYTGIAASGQPGKKGFYFTINFDLEKAVDDVFIELKAKNVTVIKVPQKTFWGGYGGFISDPEDNIWELCYNPFAHTKA